MARKTSVGKAPPPPVATSRYSRVRQILSASARGDAGEAPARFWDGSLDQFRQASLYGVPLIAPEATASCCSAASRSANSGLIKALRGEAPFDGSQFPPRPWGEAPLAAADLQFIADWIDDGCPADDLPSLDFGTLEAQGGKASLVKLTDVAEFEAFAPGAKR